MSSVLTRVSVTRATAAAVVGLVAAPALATNNVGTTPRIARTVLAVH